GIAPGSDPGILSIFSYDPRQYFHGRSPLEAAGCGVFLGEDEISFRCNIITLSEEGAAFGQRRILSHSAGSIDGEASIALLQYLLADHEFSQAAARHGFSFHPTPSFRHIMTKAGGNVEGFHATPPHDILEKPIGDYLPTGTGSEAILELMELSAKVLARAPLNEARMARGLLPGNGIWPWAEGTATILPSFQKKFGKTGLVVSAVPLVHGIARLAGLEAPEIPGATGELDTNYAGKMEAAKAALGAYDFVCVHIEAPDECTHCGDLPGKIQAIENVDGLILAPLAEHLAKCGENYRILVMPDHQTLMTNRTHGADPIPYFIYDSRLATGCGKPYGESFAEGGPFIDPGSEMMQRFFV
ncbi:MAG: phosphoglycerate mutase, partial [Clostridia bacterium]|nr:phosphoglycerate mutase [Clostridia bacterium]